MKRTSSRNIVLFFLLTIICLTIIGLGLISWENRCVEKRSIHTFVTIKDIGERKLIGLNVDKDNLNFGTISHGIMGKRSLMLTRNTNASVHIEVTGEMADWMSVIPPSPIHLSAQTPQEIHFEVTIPDSASEGNYSGKVIFCFQNN